MFSIYHDITLDRDSIKLISKHDEKLRNAIKHNIISIDRIIDIDKTVSQKAAIDAHRAVGKIQIDLQFDFESFPLITQHLIDEGDLCGIGRTIFPRCDFAIAARYSYVHEFSASMIAKQEYSDAHRAIVERYLDAYAGSLGVGRYIAAAELYHLHAARIATECARGIEIDFYGKQDQSGAINRISRFAGALASDLIFLHEFKSSAGKLRTSATTKSGIEFEIRIRDTLKSNGFYAHLTATTGDFGGDIIAERDGVRYCIQCKNLTSPAGVKAVQEAYSACSHYECDFAVVVSSGGYTERAYQMARKLGVLLHDENSISKLNVRTHS